MGLTKPFAFMGAADTGIGYGNPPYDQDLIAYYDFGDNVEGSWTGSATLTNGDVVTDLSGNGFTSTLQAPSQTFSYNSTVGKGVIETSTKNGGYFFFPTMTGSYGNIGELTMEFVGSIPTDLTQDNVIVRFKGTDASLLESNIQQYGGSPVPDRISFDLKSTQNTSWGVNPGNINTGTGFFHFVITGGNNNTSKAYWNGSEVATYTSPMNGTDYFNFDRSGNQSNTNAWFGTSNYTGGVFNGQIGVFRFYNAYMSSTDVTANYNYYSPQF